MPDLCYLCGNLATLPLQLKDSFTAHSSCKVPTSDKMCDRCNAAINGDEKQLWYWNEGKGQWSKIWGRSLSRLYQGDRLISPTIDGIRDGLRIVKDLPTRAQIREWLLNPPEPPFTIAVSESGQKHILPWAQEAHERDRFPVQFELDSLWVDRGHFAEMLSHYEALMGLEFSKTEITSGQYHSDRLMRAFVVHLPHEEIVAKIRGSRLMALIAHVAQKPEAIVMPKEESSAALPKGQLSLF